METARLRARREARLAGAKQHEADTADELIMTISGTASVMGNVLVFAWFWGWLPGAAGAREPARGMDSVLELDDVLEVEGR
jgi:hypothetical protein